MKNTSLNCMNYLANYIHKFDPYLNLDQVRVEYDNTFSYVFSLTGKVVLNQLNQDINGNIRYFLLSAKLFFKDSHYNSMQKNPNKSPIEQISEYIEISDMIMKIN